MVILKRSCKCWQWSLRWEILFSLCCFRCFIISYWFGKFYCNDTQKAFIADIPFFFFFILKKKEKRKLFFWIWQRSMRREIQFEKLRVTDIETQKVSWLRELLSIVKQFCKIFDSFVSSNSRSCNLHLNIGMEIYCNILKLMLLLA